MAKKVSGSNDGKLSITFSTKFDGLLTSIVALSSKK